jgi:ABC-2 type transport system ATP-binding protein
MTDSAIQTTNLTKVYKENSRVPVQALDGLNLTVRRGEIFGLLGRNGAGKTTLIRILTTLIPPSGGTATVVGFDIHHEGLGIRRNICAVLQENALELFLSVKDNLLTFARFHSVPATEREKRARQAIEQFGLEEHIHKKVMDLSGGLKRRLQVAKVFMVDKPIVFLDEATTGMDPINKRAALDAIRDQATKGRTIFLTTHILQEAEDLCNTIGLIHKGKLIATGDVNTIKGLASKVFEVSITFESLSDGIVQQLRTLSTLRFNHKGNTVEMCVQGIESDVLEEIARVSRLSRIHHFEVSSGTLEDAFVELLGNPREANA